MKKTKKNMTKRTVAAGALPALPAGPAGEGMVLPDRPAPSQTTTSRGTTISLSGMTDTLPTRTSPRLATAVATTTAVAGAVVGGSSTGGRSLMVSWHDAV